MESAPGAAAADTAVAKSNGYSSDMAALDWEIPEDAKPATTTATNAPATDGGDGDGTDNGADLPGASDSYENVPDVYGQQWDVFES